MPLDGTSLQAWRDSIRTAPLLVRYVFGAPVTG